MEKCISFSTLMTMMMICSCGWFRVGLDLATIEVRYEHLSVDAEAYVGGRALPTVFNFLVNILEVIQLIQIQWHRH